MLSQDFPLHAQLGLPCALKLSDTESGYCWDARSVLKVALQKHRCIALILTPLKGISAAVEYDLARACQLRLHLATSVWLN